MLPGWHGPGVRKATHRGLERISIPARSDSLTGPGHPGQPAPCGAVHPGPCSARMTWKLQDPAGGGQHPGPMCPGAWMPPAVPDGPFRCAITCKGGWTPQPNCPSARAVAGPLSQRATDGPPGHTAARACGGAGIHPGPGGQHHGGRRPSAGCVHRPGPCGGCTRRRAAPRSPAGACWASSVPRPGGVFQPGPGRVPHPAAARQRPVRAGADGPAARRRRATLMEIRVVERAWPVLRAGLRYSSALEGSRVSSSWTTSACWQASCAARCTIRMGPAASPVA
jgi:hypothetical protein